MRQSTTQKASPLAIWSAMLSVYLVWGSTYLAISFAIETIPPFFMAAVRFLIAGAVLYGWRRLAGDGPPRRIEWRSTAVVGLLLLMGGNGGVVWAEQIVPTGITALMVGSAPLWMVLIDAAAHIKRKSSYRRPGWLTFAGVGLGFLGIAVLAGPEQLTGVSGQVNPLGAGVLTAAAFLWAAGSIYSRGAPLPSSPLLATGMEMLTGGLGLLALSGLTGEWSKVDLASVSMNSLLGLGYLIVFGSLVGFASYTWLLRVAPTPLVSTYAYINPLVAILLGSLFAGEALTLRVAISAGVILGSVALISFNQPVKAAKKEEARLQRAGD